MLKPRRRCARFMESGTAFISKFTNTPNHPLVLDEDDDFVSPITVVREQPLILSHTSMKKIRKVEDKHNVDMSPIQQRKSPRSIQRNFQINKNVNQNKRPGIHIRKKPKVSIVETSQAVVDTPKNLKRKMNIYKAVKNPSIRKATPRSRVVKNANIKKATPQRFPPFHHRMSPTSMLQAIRCLTKDQKRLVNEMGFGAFFHLKIDKLPGKLCEYIVRNYQPATSSIHLQNGQVYISKQKIHDMLGLPFEGVNINSLPELPESDPLLVSWKQQFVVSGYNSSTYLDLIRESDIADDMFKLNFIVLFINTFCESNPCGTSNIRLIPRLARVQNIAGLDWCQYMMDCLETTKYRWRPDEQNLYYTGPMTLLLLLYADGVRCDGVRVKRKRPFISAMDTEDLRRIERYEIKKGGFGQGVALGNDEGVGIDDDNESDDEDLPFIWESSTVDDFNKRMINEYKKVISKKVIIEDAIMKGLTLHPENEMVRGWFARVCDVFVGFQGNHGGTADGHQDAADVNIVIPGTPSTPPHAPHAGPIPLFYQGMDPIDDFDSWDPSPRTLHEIDQIVFTTLERKRLRRSIPSFDIGLDLNIDGYVSSTVTEQKDGGFHTSGNASHVQPRTKNHGGTSNVGKDVQTDQQHIVKDKRKVKASTSLCSPYVSRTVDPSKKASADELLIGQSIFASQDEDGLVVWDIGHGDFMFLMFARTLGPSCKVSDNVIDCWAIFLNKMEDHKSMSSPYRIFLASYILTEQMLDENTDEISRYQQFKSKLEFILDRLPKDASIMDAELVFFPMVHDGNYYVIVFDLKNVYINIIDSMKPDSKVDSRYGNRPVILQSFFCHYLKELGHAKHVRLLKKKLTFFKLKWQTTKNDFDNGVYLMRHMECYMGQLQTQWTCGIEEESKASLNTVLRLRYKYITKLLLSDLNIKKEWITSQAEEFRKIDFTKRKEMVAETLEKFGLITC